MVFDVALARNPNASIAALALPVAADKPDISLIPPRATLNKPAKSTAPLPVANVLTAPVLIAVIVAAFVANILSVSAAASTPIDEIIFLLVSSACKAVAFNSATIDLY